MSSTARAKLVVMEPGVPAPAGLVDAPEQQHFLLLGADESLVGFRERVRRRADSMRRTARELSDVMYVVGHHQEADWQLRKHLLADLCEELSDEGRLAVVAPRSATGDVLGCLGELQATHSRGLSWRAVFTDTETAA